MHQIRFQLWFVPGPAEGVYSAPRQMDLIRLILRGKGLSVGWDVKPYSLALFIGKGRLGDRTGWDKTDEKREGNGQEGRNGGSPIFDEFLSTPLIRQDIYR